MVFPSWCHVYERRFQSQTRSIPAAALYGIVGRGREGGERGIRRLSETRLKGSDRKAVPQGEAGSLGISEHMRMRGLGVDPR